MPASGSQGFLCLLGGLLIAFAKEILVGDRCGMRKKNRILSCETVTRGYMIYVQTPNDQLHHRLYSGYSKRQALSMARHTDFDREAGLLFGQPCKTVKER